MSGSMSFVQSCPVCGRHLEVRVRCLGKSVSCVHCSGNFVAREDTTIGGLATKATESSLLSRADQLLNQSSLTSPSILD